MPDLPCEYCGLPVPLEWNLCPHCARPSLYPNVRAAEQPTEREALAARHRAAVEAATARGCSEVVDAFEKAASATRAVIGRSLLDLEVLVSSPRRLYATYYQQLDAEVKLPDDNRWDPLRRRADDTLFPDYREKVRFAALSLDGGGLPSYGACSLVLRDDKISHRTSVFEGNSALLMERWAYKPPLGSRAVWSERALLCVAKLAGSLLPETLQAEFASIMLRPGASPEDDEFIEAHVWGPISAGSFERVVLTSSEGTSRRRASVIVKDLRAKLAKVGLDLETR